MWSTIQQNTRVRVADVNVGNVTKIEVQDWHALVTMRINGDVQLPANSTAKVGTDQPAGRHAHRAGPARQRAAAGRAHGRLGDSAGVGRHLPDHRADAGVGVDPAQRRRAGPGAGDQPGVRQGDGRPRGRSAQPARPSWTSSSGRSTRRPTTSSRPQRVSTPWSARSPRTTRPVGQGADHDSAGAGGAGGFTQKLADAVDALGKFSAIATDTVNQTKESLVANLRNMAPVLRRTGRRRAGPHQGTGLPVDLSRG